MEGEGRVYDRHLHRALDEPFGFFFGNIVGVDAKVPAKIVDNPAGSFARAPLFWLWDAIEYDGVYFPRVDVVNFTRKIG